MPTSRIILGPIVTEKAERLKTERTYTLKVSPVASKIDVRNALTKMYGVEVSSVRMSIVGAKVRGFGDKIVEKRHPFKKAVVTLTKDSKGLDLARFVTE